MKTTYTDEQLQSAIDGACRQMASEFEYNEVSLSLKSQFWDKEATARLTLARALLDRLPEPANDEPTPPKIIPLTIDDIRATDEFTAKGGNGIEVASYWGDRAVDLAYSGTPTYEQLATDYLRRQHGSNEWKPCTKEETK